MAGITDLLGKIVGGIGKVADHPMVQGLGTAAAFGANPLVGLLAAGGIQRSRDTRALENDLTRGQVEAVQRGNRLQREMDDLLGRRQQRALPGASQLPGAATGAQLPGVPGVNAPLTQQPMAGAANTPMLQQPLSVGEGLLRSPSVPFTQTPEGQQALMTNLMQQKPGVALQGLLAQGGGSPTSFEREMGALGVDVRSPLGMELWKAKNIPAADPGQALQLRQLELATAKMLREYNMETMAMGRRQADERLGLRRGALQIESLSNATERLNGTWLQTGLPLADLRRDMASVYAAIKDKFGEGSPQAQQMIADFDIARKGFQSLVNEAITTFGGTMTNDKLAALERASANENISPMAIQKILRDIAGLYISNADLGVAGEPVELPNAEWLRDFSVGAQKSGGGGGGSGGDIASDLVLRDGKFVPRDAF
jgi:hypothetical protein